MLIRYLDRYRREPDGPWLIDDRLVQVDWSELHTVVERSSSAPPARRRGSPG
jgi:hypothetical protein